MSEFIVFYDDGTEIKGTELFFEHLPPFGVIAIVQEKHDGRNHILSRMDYYAFNGRHWVVLDMIGIVDYLVHKPKSIKKLLVGRTIDNKSYWDIFEKAKLHV